jgi:hypothetical protein
MPPFFGWRGRRHDQTLLALAKVVEELRRVREELEQLRTQPVPNYVIVQLERAVATLERAVQ